MRRWIPTVTMMLVSTLSYIDRNALALLIPSIRADTGMSAEQYGYIVSSFSVAYMIGNPAWGAILDRAGLRWGMLAAVALWTAASAGHALAAGAGAFLALRFLLGFGEGATFPGAFPTVVQTLPPASRGRGIALSYSGGSLGAIITPVVVTPVALAFGWRGGFWFTGVLGLLWMIWWWRLSQRADLSVRGDLGGGGKLNWRDRRLWGAMASYSLGSVPLGFILYNSPLYLTARFGLTQAELGQLLWIPPLGWECGYFLWGWLIDRLGLDAAGKLMLVAAALSLPIAAAPATDRLAVLMLQLFLAMLVTSGFIIPSIQHAARITPPGSISLVAGLGAGSFSLLIAILAPWFGRLFDQRDYATAFTAAALFPVLGSSLFAAANGIRGGHRSAGGAGSSPESERR